MNLDDVREILELMRDNGLSEFEIERDGLKLRLRKDSTGSVVSAPHRRGGVYAERHRPAGGGSCRPGGCGAGSGGGRRG